MKNNLIEIIRKELNKQKISDYHLINEASEISSNCEQNSYLIDPTEEELANIPKDENGKITFCKYNAPARPIFLPVGTKDFTQIKTTPKTWAEKFVKKLIKKGAIKSEDETSSIDSLSRNITSLNAVPGALGGFTLPSGVEYGHHVFTEDNLKTINNFCFGRKISEEKMICYKSPNFLINQNDVKYRDDANLTLQQAFYAFKFQEKTWNERILEGWSKYVNEDTGEIYQGSPSWAQQAKDLYEKRITEGTSTKVNQTITNIFTSLFATNLPQPIVYVKKDGTTLKLDAADYFTIPKDWNPKEWGVEYGNGKTNPPKDLLEPSTGEYIQVLIPGNVEKTDDPKFNSKYKVYYSPHEIVENFKKNLDNSNLDLMKLISSNQTNMDVFNNPILLRLYTKEEMLDKLNKCKGVLEFLTKIIRGELYNTKRKKVGYYFLNDRGQSELAKWDGGILGKSDEIPCGSEFWEDYGVTIQTSLIVISMVVTGVLTGGAGWAAWAAVGADIVGNAWAMYFDAKAQDKKTLSMDAGFLLLAPLFEVRMIKNALTTLAAGKKLGSALDNVFNYFETAKRNNYTIDQIKQMIGTFSDEEMAALRLIDDATMSSTVREATKFMADEIKMKAGSLVGIGRRALPISLEVFTNLAWAGGFLLNDYLDAIKIRAKKENANLNLEDEKTWAFILSNMKQDEADKLMSLFNTISGSLGDTTNSPEFSQLTQELERQKNKKLGKTTSDKEVKEDIDNLTGLLQKLGNKIKQTYSVDVDLGTVTEEGGELTKSTDKSSEEILKIGTETKVNKGPGDKSSQTLTPTLEDFKKHIQGIYGQNEKQKFEEIIPGKEFLFNDGVDDWTYSYKIKDNKVIWQLEPSE